MKQETMTLVYALGHTGTPSVATEAIAAHEGILLPTLDGILAGFSDTKMALQYAAIVLSDGQREDENTDVRLGIGHGSFTVSETGAYGECVNIAMGLAKDAPKGSILVDASVMNAVGDAAPAHRVLGPRVLEKVPKPVLTVQLERQQGDEKSPGRHIHESNKSPNIEPVFDFSRVEQERLQEELSLLQPTAHPELQEATIPLAAPKATEDAYRSSGTRAREVFDEPMHLMKNVRVRDRRRKLALVLFGVLNVAVPLILIASSWTYQRITTAEMKKRDADFQRQVESSEILNTLSRPSRKEVENEAGSLRVTSDPPGAQIFIDDAPRSERTPARIFGIHPGVPFRLRIVKPGFESQEQFLNITPGQTKEVEVRLQPKD